MISKADRTFLLGAALLLCLTLLVFARSLNYDFSYYDDDVHVIKNPLVQSLSVPNLRRIFTEPHLTSYYPLRALSFAFDYAFWALNPRGYHATNVAIHCLNVLLVFVLARRLLGHAAPAGRRVWAAGLGAALFGVHPVVVEPVVWVSGREELLMVLFSLLSVLAYARARNGRGVRASYVWSGLAIVGCAAACLSNALGMVVPALAAAYDFTCVRKADAPVGRWCLGMLARTWPLWLIAGVALVGKQISDGQGPPMGSLRVAEHLCLAERLRLIPSLYAGNLKTLVWPDFLMVSYPGKIPDGFLDVAVGVGLLCAVGTVWALWWMRRLSVPLFGLLWFVLALGPSAQVAPHHIYRADRFLYLPLIGVALAVAGWVLRAARRPAWRRAMPVVLASVACVLAVRSVGQTRLWRDGVTLFSHALERSPDSATVHTNLGNALLRAGRHAEVIPHYLRALELAPDDANSHFNLGNALREVGRPEEAIASYSRAIAIRPDDFEIHNNLAATLLQRQQVDDALRHFLKALSLAPGNLDLRCNVAALLGTRQRHAEAIREFSEVLRRRPTFVQARINIAISLLQTGDRETAVMHLSEALRVRPESVKARTVLAAALRGAATE